MARYQKYYMPYFLLCGMMLYALGSGIAHFLAVPFHHQVFLLGFIWIFSLQFGIVFFNKYHKEKDSINTQQNRLSISRTICIAAFSFTLLASTSAMIFQRGNITPTLTMCMLLMILGTILYYYPPSILKNVPYSEVFSAIFLANLIPFFAYALQAGNYHRLVGMSTFPLTALFLALSIIIRLPEYGHNEEFIASSNPVYKIVSVMGWNNGMKLHNILILCAYLILGLAVIYGFPFSFALPVFFTLPIGLFQIWQLSQIAEGGKPNWLMLIGLGAGLFGACVYLLAYAFWTN